MAIISVFIRCSNKRLLYIHSESFIHFFTGLCGSNIRITSHLAYQLSWQSAAPVWQRSWVQIPCSPDFFFQALFSLLLNQCSLLRKLLSYSHIFVMKPIDHEMEQGTDKHSQCSKFIPNLSSVYRQFLSRIANHLETCPIPASFPSCSLTSGCGMIQKTRKQQHMRLLKQTLYPG